jgi:hypothetical protein
MQTEVTKLIACVRFAEVTLAAANKVAEGIKPKCHSRLSVLHWIVTRAQERRLAA